MSDFYDASVISKDEAVKALRDNLVLRRFDKTKNKPLPMGASGDAGMDSYESHFLEKPGKRLYAIEAVTADGGITVQPGDQLSDLLTRTSETYQVYLVLAGAVFDYRQGRYYPWTGPGHEPVWFTRILVEPRIEAQLAA